MKRVLLRFYNFNNLGDDLFAKIISNRYKNKFSFIVRENVPLFKSLSNLKVYKNQLKASLFYNIEKVFKKRNIWLNHLTKKNDLLIYIGGSLFIEGSDKQVWQQEQEFYSHLKVPYYIVGSNIGPYSNESFLKILEDIFRRAEDVCFRDRASYELFKYVDKTRLATDIAFSLDTSNYTIKNEKIAIFSLIDCTERFGSAITEKYDQEIINMTRQFAEKNYRIIYMSFCKYEGDEIANERIARNLDKGTMKKVEIYNYSGDLEEALSLIAKCEIIIATRFHAVILGLLFSKKILPLAYSKKTTNILNDLEFKGDIVDILNINKFNGNKYDFDNLQINDSSRQIQLAELQFKELDKVLVRK